MYSDNIDNAQALRSWGSMRSEVQEQLDKFVKEEDLGFRRRVRRWFREQDEVNFLKQKRLKPNSEAQEYYNIKAASLDRGQMYEIMEDLAKAGLMGHDQETEFKKRFGGGDIEIGWKIRIPLNLFLLRMFFEGIFRGAKGGFLVSGVELLKSSFKGAVK